MNANRNRNRNRICALIAIFVLACQTPVFAFNFPDPATDPFKTAPAVIQRGATLPGDRAPISCSAQKDFTQPLALGEAVDFALCNNPQIKSAWADIKIKAGALGEAHSAFLPMVTGSLNLANDQLGYPSSDIPASSSDRATFQGGLTWRIFDFGGRAANHHAAESLLTAALANHSATLQRALAAVIQAYFDAMTAKATLKATTEGEKIAQMTLTSAQARQENGAVSLADTLRATTALAKAVLENNRAQGAYQKGMAVLGHILGVPGNKGIVLPEELNADTAEIGKDLDRWLEETRKNHPAIVAANAQVRAAQEKVTVARSAGLPTLNFAGNYYQNTRPGQTVTPTETTETTLMAMVNIPFFEGFSSVYKIRGAQAEVEQKEAELADTEYRIALELIKSYADAAAALQNLDASANLLAAAQEAIAVSQRRYEKGAADITEILSTLSTLSDAQRERIRCLADWHSARLRLLASAGQIGKRAVAE